MIVALLTDFGTRDHYVGTMKGVVLSVCPDATLVDITHEIPPQDTLAAALELEASYRYFPPGTVFLVVVDPGVGSERRAIAADAGGYRFAGPDNGVLSTALTAAGLQPGHVVELKERKFARTTISKTFEGRDRFAPAAGWLARGTELGAFGPVLSEIRMLDVPVAQVTPDGIEGQVLRVDRFGNLITNIDHEMLATLGAPRVTINGREISGVVSTYAEVARHELCALIGSSGRLEIAVNGGHAAETLAIGRGAVVVLRRNEAES